MYNYLDKKTNLQNLNNYMLLKTLSMFDYEGLPDSMDSIILEKQLQEHGSVFITSIDNKLYSLVGSFGGELDEYDQPKKIMINNIALNISEEFDIKIDGVLIKNDDLNIGMLPLLNKYNSMLVENEITMYLNTFNNRIQTLISASDDITKANGEKYLEKVIDGKLGIIGENVIFDGIKTHSNQSSKTTNIMDIVEFNQYIKASLLHEVGINANYNMKRERLNTSEVELNDDVLTMLPNNMFYNRVKGVEKVNKMYGTNIKVEFNSIWKKEDDEFNEYDFDEDDSIHTENFTLLEELKDVN